MFHRSAPSVERSSVESPGGMRSLGQVRLILPTAIAVFGVLVLVLLAVTIPRPSPQQHGGEQFSGPLMPPGMHAPGFSLLDQNHRSATLVQYRGRVILLGFMYSHCTTACPLMATEIRGALDDLPGAGRDVPVLAISVDPAHDSQSSARRFIAREQMTGRMRFLLGQRHQLVPIWKRYEIQPLAARQDHSAFVFLIDRQGLARVGFPASELVPEDLAHDLRLLLAERPAPR